MKKIACFITPHGFGHAARMTAVLEALQHLSPDIYPHIFTTIPESLFAETLGHFHYHPLACDIGLIQKDGLHTDIPATIHHLQEFLPFSSPLTRKLAESIQGVSLVLCDIAPLGIAVAKEAAIPSVLIENFTWDWIYKAYLPLYPNLQPYIDILTAYFRKADVHIRCTPCCGSTQGDLLCEPVFRRIRTPRLEMRKRLGCSGRKLILISMGGIAVDLPFIHMLPGIQDTTFIIAGQKSTKRLADNILLLARDSGYYHPDIINSADLVVCKSGYSTVAECYQARVPVLTVGRNTFPESPILEQFSADQLHGQAIPQTEFFSGSWLGMIASAFPHSQKDVPHNGADTVAEFLCSSYPGLQNNKLP